MLPAVPADKVHKYLRRSFSKKALEWVDNARWSKDTIPIKDINLDRKLEDTGLIDKFKNKFQDGEKVHRVVLMANGSKYDIADGHHRVVGAKEAGKKAIRAWVGRRGPDGKALPERRILKEAPRGGK